MNNISREKESSDNAISQGRNDKYEECDNADFYNFEQEPVESSTIHQIKLEPVCQITDNSAEEEQDTLAGICETKYSDEQCSVKMKPKEEDLEKLIKEEQVECTDNSVTLNDSNDNKNCSHSTSEHEHITLPAAWNLSRNISFVSDSTSDDEDCSITNDSSSQEQFISLLKDHKILFNKSQVPRIKLAKEKALVSLKADYIRVMGKDISDKQLRKKIHNMKNEVKKNINAKGNKRKNLKTWEIDLLLLMDYGKNPGFSKGPGAMTVGLSDEMTPSAPYTSVPPPPSSVAACTSTIQQPSVKRIKYTKLPETEETVKLSTPELQRLLILEQLQLVRKQKEREELLLAKLRNEVIIDNIEVLTAEPETFI